MKYKVIFTNGYTDDLESLTRDLRADVLISDIQGNLYRPIFITIERITNMFNKNEVCYLEDKLVILHSVTKDNILKASVELHEWMFYKRWIPLTEERLQIYFYPKENWTTFEIDVPENGI
jgi:hypothetical protein